MGTQLITKGYYRHLFDRYSTVEGFRLITMVGKTPFMDRIKQKEDGMTLIEMMVSIIIIVTVLLSSAYALNAAFAAQASGEVKSRAVQIAREEMEQMRQRDYTNTRILNPTDVRPGDVPVPESYKGEFLITKKVTRTNPSVTLKDFEDKGAIYVKTREINGTRYTVRTIVTQTTSATFDAAGANIQLEPAIVNGKSVVAPVVKRVTIIVTWDIGTGPKQTAATWVRSPTPAECIPPRVEQNGAAGNDKWDAQERIQACETRR